MVRVCARGGGGGDTCTHDLASRHAAPQHRYKFRETLKQKLADIHATPKASVKRRRRQKAIVDPRKIMAAAKHVKSSRLASYGV